MSSRIHASHIESNDTVLPVLIVGAGPAGLAVAACLRKAGVGFVILEQSRHVGDSWRKHYDRLHLHTPKAFSALPHMRFPSHYPTFPSRDQVVTYLEDYTAHFGVEPRFGERVISARFDGAIWKVTTETGSYRAARLVVATGYNREPVHAVWPGAESYRGRIIHSSTYRNGAGLKGKRVLVVGFGNSGGEIALDLCEHGAEVTMSVRGPVNAIPRTILGIPTLGIGIVLGKLPPRVSDALNAPILRLATGDLRRLGLKTLPWGPTTQVHEKARIPLVDVGTLALIRRGVISLRPGIERLGESGVVFADGRQENFDLIVCATGFRPRVDTFLQENAGILDTEGSPVTSGEQTALPGLFFCGFEVSRKGMLRQISFDARRIARQISSVTLTGQ